MMLDLDRIEELRDEVGEDDFREIALMFLDEIETVLDRLGADPDCPSRDTDLHFLKGSALNLGFDEMSVLCDRDRAPGSAPTDVQRIIAVYEDSKARLIREVGSLG